MKFLSTKKLLLCLGTIILVVLGSFGAYWLPGYFAEQKCYKDATQCKFTKTDVVKAIKAKGISDATESDVGTGNRGDGSAPWVWVYLKSKPDSSCSAKWHIDTLQMDPASGKILYFYSGCQQELHADAAYINDFSDDRVLIGASHNVFIGRVTKFSSTRDLGGGPETQFQVTVIENIKGNLSGDVIVDQLGGFKNGVLYLFEDSDKSSDGMYLLQPGNTYLFATRYNKEQNWYTLNTYSTAKELLSTDANISVDATKHLTDNNPRVLQLKSAYPNEILLDYDVKYGNTLNSYASVHAVEAQASHERPAPASAPEAPQVNADTPPPPSSAASSSPAR